MKSKHLYQPSLLIDSGNPSDLKLKSEILSIDTNINRYSPIVYDNKKVSIFECISELTIAVQNSSIRNKTLLDIRRVIDGVNLIKKYADSSFYLEIKLNESSLKMGVLIEYLQKNILSTIDNERVIFSVDRGTVGDISAIYSCLSKLRHIGFSTMMIYKGGSLLFDTQIKQIQWIKIDVGGMSVEELTDVIPFIDVYKGKGLKITFCGVDNEGISRCLDEHGFEYKQGDFIGLPVTSLISGLWSVG